MSVPSSRLARAAVTVLLLSPMPLLHADGGHGPRADSHAPIGVMGEHVHDAGELMFSYRYMRMKMAGNRIGQREVSPEFIVQKVPNRFAPPDTLRVVPTDMTMEMHMIGGMYGLTDTVTLMAMLPVLSNSMNHVTFRGASGTDRLGTFQTQSSGIGDVGLSGLFRVHDDGANQVVARLGLRAPTGDVEDTDDVLTPMGTRPSLRLPYPMQVGTGTFAVNPGLTWRRYIGAASVGINYDGLMQLGRNDEGYTQGDQHAISSWATYGWAPWISTSVRVRGETRERVQGFDSEIAAPVQTAQPDFQGGDRAEIGLGLNLLGTRGALDEHRLAVEYLLPFYQDLNGPQLETDSTLILGYQYAWE
jgi:hypothetical protein